MNQKKAQMLSSKIQEAINGNNVFSGIWINWKRIALPEQVVCLGILLIPLWWIIGWSYIPLLWVFGISAWEILNHKKIRLEMPSISAIALLLFSFHRILSYALNSPELAPRALVDPLLFWGCSSLLLWYIESHKIRIRLEIIAWALSVVVCMMLLFWLFFHFVIGEKFFIPTPNLVGLFLDKSSYNTSKLGSIGNFLVPYAYGNPGVGGLLRYNFFFTHPTVASFIIGFTGLVVLDVKNRYWSFSILTICSFLIVICQTRNAWIALPITLIFRWLHINFSKKNLSLLLALIALIFFLIFSVPHITNFVSDSYINLVNSTISFRKDSSEVRNLIYQRTLEKILEEPSLIGYGVNGPTVLPGYEFAGLGTESFILGSLMYKSGLIGTGIFAIFLISFLFSITSTKDRPISSFLMIIYLSLCSLVTEFSAVEMFIVLISGMSYKKLNVLRKKF
jgi:O-Antigen ligase